MANDIKRRVVSSLAWKVLERGGSSLVSLIVQIALARLLEPSDFGSMAIILMFVNIANVVVQSGLNTALVQSPNASSDDFTTVFWLSFAVSIALFAVFFLLAPHVELFFGVSGLLWPLRLMGLVLMIGAYNSVQVAFAQRNLDFRLVFISTFCAAIVSGAVGVAMALNGAGLWALVGQAISMQVVSCVALAVQVPWSPSLHFNLARAGELFGYGWKLLASGLLNVGYQSLSDFVIGKRFSSVDLGFVSQGKKYPQAIGSLLDGSIQPVMLSAVSRVQDDPAYVKRLVRRALKTSVFLVTPCMACFALVAEPLVLLVLGEKWLPCVPFFQLYCVVYALLPIHSTNLQALNGMGRSGVFFALEVIKKTYGVAILLFTSLVIGDVLAIVVGYVVADVISTFVNAYPSKRVIGYPYGEQLADILPAVGIALVSFAVAWPLGLVGMPPILQLLSQVVVMGGSYLGLSWLIHLEAMSYLVDNAFEILGNKGGVS